MCSIKVSTKDQTKEEFSLPVQKERLEAIFKFKGYKIYDYYTDAGISAKTGNHIPEFDILIEDTIEYIFKNSDIIEIRKTDKVGLE